MKKIVSLFFVASFFFSLAQPNPQTKKVTEKFFPDLDIEINTPAFKKRKGFTKYTELIAFLDAAVASHSEFIQYSFIGSSQKGKQIPVVTLTNGKSNKNKTKVWLQGGLHGDEPASTEGLLYLIDQLLNNPTERALLDDLLIQVVPMANIDGYEKQNRHAANGLDLNRDQTKLMAPESVLLKKAFSDFNPEVAVDFHEYRPYRRDFARMSDWGVTSAFDVMFLYSGNLNIPFDLRQYTTEAFVNPAKEKMDELHLQHADYASTGDYLGDIHFNLGGSSPRSSASSYALSNCVSSLIEVRGVGIGRTSFKRRVFTTYSVALSYLHSSVKNADKVQELLGRYNEMASDKVVLKSSRPILSGTMKMIDLSTNEYIELECVIHNALQSRATFKRIRPTAYLLLPSETAAAEKLKTLGVAVHELTEEKSIEVEAYTISKYKRESYAYEGIHPQEVETIIESQKVLFPKGSYVVLLNQERSNLAVSVLEPEVSSGFVHFEVIKAALGQELPVYRYTKAEELLGLN